MTKVVLAVDPSIQCSGIAIDFDGVVSLFSVGEKIPKRDDGLRLVNADVEIEYVKVHRITENSILRYITTANKIADTISKVIGTENDIDFIIEGGSFGSKGKLHSIGEFSGVLQTILYHRFGVIASVCSPSQWKKGIWGKGKGTVKKDFIWGKFQSVCPDNTINWKDTNPIQDSVDAYFILKYLKSSMI